MNKIENNVEIMRNGRLLLSLAVFFSILTWIVLLPAFYVRNLFLLPLHEITAWAQQQVEIFESFGLQLDVWSFRRYASSFSAFAPLVSLASSSISVLAGSLTYRRLKTRDDTLKVRKLLNATLALGILGILTTVLVFGLSLFYLFLYWLMYGF
jgi:hypothetical protein